MAFGALSVSTASLLIFSSPVETFVLCQSYSTTSGARKHHRSIFLALGGLTVLEWKSFAMKPLLIVHKILISSAVIFFIFFALWELRNYFDANDSWALFRTLLYFLVAIGFGVYLKNLKRWYK